MLKTQNLGNESYILAQGRQKNIYIFCYREQVENKISNTSHSICSIKKSQWFSERKLLL